MNNANQSLDQVLGTLNQALTELTSQEHADSQRNVNFHAKDGDSNYGKGLTWTGYGKTKQLILLKSGIYSSENLDLPAEKSYCIEKEPVLSKGELGSSITKSSLKQVGRLNGLIVDGSVSINQHIYYDSRNKKLGIGTDNPKSLISLHQDRSELHIDIKNSRANIDVVGGLDITSGKSARISISDNGAISLGDKDSVPVQVSVHGQISVKVNNPDPSVDLHVSGPVRLHGRMFAYADKHPISGVHQLGDLTWNSQPMPGKPVGWVCVRAGNPGVWAPFGTINQIG